MNGYTNVVSPHNGILSSLKRRDIPTRTNLEDVTLNEISQEQMDKYRLIPRGPGAAQLRDGGGRLAARGRGRGGGWRGSVEWMGAQPQLGKMPKFWRRMVGTGAQQSELI